MNTSLLERYRPYLPISDATPIITLGEGDTPLVRSRLLADRLGCEELYFKLEGCNPSGSFKDRGMVVAVAKALEEGATGLICASTGNTSASAAAYGARTGLPTTVVVPKEHVARGKLAQAVAYGAKVVLIDGNFDDALSLVRSLAERNPLVLVNSVNPHRIQGQKTAAFELVEALEGAPDHVFLPVGNAGNIIAYWQGFTEARDLGWVTSRPKMMGFQAVGAAPIVRNEPVVDPDSIASAIRVGRPAGWEGAVRAREESGGVIDSVTDDEIMDAYRLLARGEGIFCEPASASSVAGLLKLSDSGLQLGGKRVVCIITGTGLKDPDVARQIQPVSMEEHPAKLAALERALPLA